ncbi:MAG: hypothetical protein ACW98A_15985, partial [Candidatus Hodarchaeales archaeon]
DAILKLFNLNEVNFKKIERAYRTLFEHNIISFTGLLNLNKLGFNYFLADNNITGWFSVDLKNYLGCLKFQLVNPISID